MKNILLLAKRASICLVVSFLSLQCDRRETTVPQFDKAPFTVSIKDAVEIAQHYNTNENQSKSGARIESKSDVISEETIVDESSQRPLLHVINKVKGFIIVSADLRTMPVLAYSTESQFDTKAMPLGIKNWVESAKSKINDAKRLVKADSIVIKEWKKYLAGELNLPKSGARNSNCYEWYQYGQYMCQSTFNDRGPLLNTQWGQDYLSSTSLTWAYTSCGPCARFAAGCGPVAMAQVYEYYRSNPNRPRTSSYSCNYSTSGEYDLGQLMLACGNAANSQYHAFGTCNTFTWPSDVINGLSQLGFASGGNQSAAYNYQTIKNELLSNHPLIFWGSTCTTCFSDYHIWVCDGIQEHNYSEFDCDTKQCSQWAYSALHMNWGWEYGSYNGWYSFGQYNPAGQDYNSNLHIISGIRS